MIMLHLRNWDFVIQKRKWFLKQQENETLTSHFYKKTAKSGQKCSLFSILLNFEFYLPYQVSENCSVMLTVFSLTRNA